MYLMEKITTDVAYGTSAGSVGFCSGWTTVWPGYGGC